LKNKVWPFIISIGIALAVGGLSAYITAGNMQIYNEINKPALAPPGILFPIVWTVLYILMGVSAALIYNNRYKDKEWAKCALTVYGISLVINFFWSPIFFNLRAYLLAFIWIVLLWISVLVTILKYKKISPVAAYLQIPYLLWCAFAGYLSFAVFALNR